jgi:hypothetical protein
MEVGVRFKCMIEAMLGVFALDTCLSQRGL